MGLKKLKVEEDPEFMVGQSKGSSYRRWTLEENIKYAHFLRLRWFDLSREQRNEEKRKYLFYQNMSAAVGSKNNHQCRSHHIKMMNTHKNCQSIITFFLDGTKRQDEEEHLPSQNTKSPSNSEKDFPKFKQQPLILVLEAEFKEIHSDDDRDGQDSYFPSFKPPCPSLFK